MAASRVGIESRVKTTQITYYSSLDRPLKATRYNSRKRKKVNWGGVQKCGTIKSKLWPAPFGRVQEGSRTETPAQPRGITCYHLVRQMQPISWRIWRCQGQTDLKDNGLNPMGDWSQEGFVGGTEQGTKKVGSQDNHIKCDNVNPHHHDIFNTTEKPLGYACEGYPKFYTRKTTPYRLPLWNPRFSVIVGRRWVIESCETIFAYKGGKSY